MQTFKIGDQVKVRATASIRYDARGHRHVDRDDCRPFVATVTGQVRKMLGEYCSGRAHATWDGPSDDPPSLTVTGSVLLWGVRKKMAGREIWVADEDLEIADETA